MVQLNMGLDIDRQVEVAGSARELDSVQEQPVVSLGLDQEAGLHRVLGGLPGTDSLRVRSVSSPVRQVSSGGLYKGLL